MSCFMCTGDNEAWSSVAFSCVFFHRSPFCCNTCPVHIHSFGSCVVFCPWLLPAPLVWFWVFGWVWLFLAARLIRHAHATSKLEYAREDWPVRIFLPSFSKSTERSYLCCLNADFNANDKPQYIQHTPPQIQLFSCLKINLISTYRTLKCRQVEADTVELHFSHLTKPDKKI